MANRKSSRVGSRLLLVLFLIALIIGAAYLLNRCGMGGFGLGTGSGPGSGSSSPSAAPSASIKPSANASATGPGEPVLIRVTGTSCKIGKAEEAQECDRACAKADEQLKGLPKREVRLSPAKGSQEIVERLKKCLTEKGLVILEVDD